MKIHILIAIAASFLHLELLAAPCDAPVSLDDGWAVSTPAEAGFDAAALCAVLEGVAQGPTNLHSVIVQRHGKLLAEMYRKGADRSVWSWRAQEVDFNAAELHDMRSVSKSVVSLLVGVVQQQGGIGKLDTPVLDFYPSYADLRDSKHEAITLQHLLTMSSGLDWNEGVTSYGTFRNDETRLYWSWSPYRDVMARDVVAAPGTLFNYNGGGTAVLADVISRASGQNLRDLARTALFEPMGIRDWEWIGDLHRRPIAFAGLRLRPRDLAKLGRLMLDHGRWEGRQLVPAAWIDESIQPRVEIGNGLQYGYQWWLGSVDHQGRKLPWAAAVGNGGQRLYVVPALDLSVVVTGGLYNDPTIGRALNRLLGEVVNTLRDD